MLPPAISKLLPGRQSLGRTQSAGKTGCVSTTNKERPQQVQTPESESKKYLYRFKMQSLVALHHLRHFQWRKSTQRRLELTLDSSQENVHLLQSWCSPDTLGLYRSDNTASNA